LTVSHSFPTRKDKPRRYAESFRVLAGAVGVAFSLGGDRASPRKSVTKSRAIRGGPSIQLW
jgi:hypothetical protein